MGRLEIYIQLCWADKNFGLDEHSVEIHFDPKTRVSWPCIQIIGVKGDREETGWFQCVGKIKVVSKIEIPAGKSPFGRLFIKVH